MKTKSMASVSVANSQIEIDAAFEGPTSLAIIEAKREFSNDFLVRQLYYPYRLWMGKVEKRIRPIFLVYSNGIFSLYEYQFVHPDNYNSLYLVKQMNYSLESTEISFNEVRAAISNVGFVVDDPDIPFPQANDFERVVNLCSFILKDDDYSVEELTEKFAFDIRQTYYYTDAARYLGLVERFPREKNMPAFKLTALGKKVARMNYKDRMLEFCKLVLCHEIFRKVYDLCLAQGGNMPDTNAVAQIMRSVGIPNVDSEKTFVRRASTVKHWVSWVFSVVND